MYSIQQLRDKTEQGIQELSISKEPKQLYDPIDYLLGLGGKRMRPALLLAACNLFSNDVEEAINPALGIELFHNFTLVHDDIMDEAPLRRGKSTVHTKYDSNTAILSGDVLFVIANELISRVAHDKIGIVLPIFFKAAREVCEGQQYDMNFERQESISIADYLKMIELKTAVLLAAALQIGGVMGGANDKDAHLLYNYGRDLGIAFQLQDDILDTFGDATNFGKRVGGDIVQSKKTFLLLKTRELADKDQLEKLNKWLAISDMDEEKIAVIKELYEEVGVRQQSEQEMQKYHQKAIQALNEISVSSDRKAVLEQFASQLMVRTT